MIGGGNYAESERKDASKRFFDEILVEASTTSGCSPQKSRYAYFNPDRTDVYSNIFVKLKICPLQKSPALPCQKGSFFIHDLLFRICYHKMYEFLLSENKNSGIQEEYLSKYKTENGGRA